MSFRGSHRMGSHSEIDSWKSFEAALERFDKRMDEGFEELCNKMDAEINRMRWMLASLYAYLLAWVIWFYFEFRS